MIWALVAVVIVMGLVFSGGAMLRSSAQQAETHFRTTGQAQDVARAGLVDAYAWFRRQTSQPVATFAPQRDLLATPPVNETDDPSVGLVREFEISSGIWGRYEVRVHSDIDGNGRPDPGEGTYDATARRSLPGTGTVWHVESRGFVYRRKNPALAWNVEPNQRIAGAVVATELRRLNLVPPGLGALCCARGDAVTIGTRGSVDGGGAAGVLYASSTGSATVTGDLSGSPGQGSLPGYDGSVDAVFGVTLEDLKSISTIRMPATDPLPSPLPDYALVVVEGDLVVAPAAPLRGTGILVVDGDLIIAPGTNSYFTGLIYVTGDYEQRAPSLVRGAVVVEGSVSISGSGDYAELVHDSAILDDLMREVGRYRISRALHRLDRDAWGAGR